MVILNRLPTNDRLSRMGLAQDLLCPLCKTEPETTSHLFFSCRYTQEIWQLIMKDTTRIPPLSWEALIDPTFLSASGLCNNTKFKQKLSATAYYIWLERNRSNFEGSALSSQVLANMALAALSKPAF